MVATLHTEGAVLDMVLSPDGLFVAAVVLHEDAHVSVYGFADGSLVS